MLRNIWVLMLILSLVCLVVGVLLIFVWRIPDLIDELSGRKAKRQIKMLHDLNVNTSPLDNMSTNELYTGISNGSILIDNLAIDSGMSTNRLEHTTKNNSTEEDEDGDNDVEVATEYLSDSTNETVTEYLDNDDEVSTEYLDEVNDEDVDEIATSFLENVNNTSKIVILEEQSSL